MADESYKTSVALAGRSGKTSAGLLIGLCVTAVVAVLGCLGWPNYLELKLLDVRHRLFPSPRGGSDIVTVVIDDNSLEQVGRWPWPRGYIAEFISLCHQAGAREVILDIFMPEVQPRQLEQVGTTDVNPYEPPVKLIGEPLVVEVNNDALLTDAMLNADNVALAFYSPIQRDSYVAGGVGALDRTAITVADERLIEDVSALLDTDGGLSFEQVFNRLMPDKNIDNPDEDYHQLLLAYIRSLGLNRLRRFGFVSDAGDSVATSYDLSDITPPIPYFVDAASNSGFVSSVKDSDGVVRRIPLVARYEGRVYKQLAFAALCRAVDVADDDIDLSQPGRILLNGVGVEIPLDETGRMIVSWSGQWDSDPCIVPITYFAQTWQMAQEVAGYRERLGRIDDLTFQLSSVPEDVSELDAESQEAVVAMKQELAALGDVSELRRKNAERGKRLEENRDHLRRLVNGRSVFVGSVATGAPDFVVTPWSDLTPGIAVHGRVFDTIMGRTFIRRLPRLLEVALVLLLGAVMTVVSAVFRPLASGLAVVLLATSTLVLNAVVGFGYAHYWIAVVTPVAAILTSFTAVTFYRQITEGRHKRRITARFKQYVAPSVVDRIVESAAGFTFAGETRELSCYFSDLGGFTSISERLGPEKTVSVLNIYLDRMTEVLDRYTATINKFEGDGIFAFFGAPVTLPDHGKLACQAAQASQEELAKLVREQQADNAEFPTLSMRVGLSTGPAVVGDCGSQRRFDYTAIGDTVNLAARLESANKAFGSKMMISETTWEQAREHIDVRYLGKVRVVGKAIGVGIYELLGEAGSVDDEQKEYSRLFEAAVEHYQQQRFDQAVAELKQCADMRGDDKAAELYLAIAQRFCSEPCPDDFNGCVELTQK